MSVFVWGSYDDVRRIQGAVGGLVESSFPPEEIRVHLRDAAGDREIPVRHKTRAPIGCAIGALLGAALWSIVLDGVSGAAWMGAAIGAMSGAYAGVFWWRQEVDVPSEAEGRAVVGITAPEGRARQASAILRAAGAHRVGVSERAPPRDR